MCPWRAEDPAPHSGTKESTKSHRVAAAGWLFAPRQRSEVQEPETLMAVSPGEDPGMQHHTACTWPPDVGKRAKYFRKPPRPVASHCSGHFSESQVIPLHRWATTPPRRVSLLHQMRPEAANRSSSSVSIGRTGPISMVYHIRKYLSPVVSPLFHGSGRVSSRIEYQGVCKGQLEDVAAFILLTL